MVYDILRYKVLLWGCRLHTYKPKGECITLLNLDKAAVKGGSQKNQLQWPTEEERQAMTYEEGQQLARDYFNGKYKHAGYKPPFMKWLRYKTGPLFGFLLTGLAILIIYGLVNLVLVGGQNLWHAGDKKELQAIEATLKSWDGKIYMYELDIKNETISDGDYNDYTELIDKYNIKVKEYNELAEKVGTTFYIVPIPGRK